MSRAPESWRADRARAIAMSHHLRYLTRTYGRVPNCAPGRLGWAELERWILDHEPPRPVDRAGPDAGRCAGRRALSIAGYLADRLRVDRSQVYRWRAAGLAVRDADRVAIGLGTHPALIWPEFYDVTHDPMTVPEAVAS